MQNDTTTIVYDRRISYSKRLSFHLSDADHHSSYSGNKEMNDTKPEEVTLEQIYKELKKLRKKVKKLKHAVRIKK